MLDLRGLRCPLPVLRTRKALALATSCAIVTVISDDPLSLIDIPNFAREAGHEIVETRRDGRAATFVIRRAL